MKKRILCVDDDVGPRESLRMILTSNGYYVSTAEDASGALQKLQEAVTPYDLIITGIIMPGMRGDEMISKICRDNMDIPIIVVSGNHKKGCELVKEGLVSAFFPKPYTVTDLLNTVKILISDTLGTC